MAHAARFVTGSIPGHILSTTAAASVGLLAVFAVDLADMWYLSLLGETELAAAIGYAGAILFFTTSIGIGFMIAMSVRVSRSIGAGDTVAARRSVSHILMIVLATSLPVAAVATAAVDPILGLLGASGRTAELAADYLSIVLPSMPLLALAMAFSGALRGVGATRLAMLTTMTAGLVNLVFAPVFIFVLGWGVEGAAAGTVLGRLAAFLWSAHAAIRRHDLVGRTTRGAFVDEIRVIAAIATPAILANVATPVAAAYVTAAMAPFGDSAVAGWAVVSRLQPVAFAFVFAMSGAVGPIFGQNAGAGNTARVRQTLIGAISLGAVGVGLVWLILMATWPFIAAAFNASAEAAELIRFFCIWIAPAFAFTSAQFASHAAFNNLGKPHWSTLSNWGRATLGTMPLVWLGAELYGPDGVLAGFALGGILFGTLASVAAKVLIARGPTVDAEAADPLAVAVARRSVSPVGLLRGLYGPIRRR